MPAPRSARLPSPARPLRRSRFRATLALFIAVLFVGFGVTGGIWFFTDPTARAAALGIDLAAGSHPPAPPLVVPHRSRGFEIHDLRLGMSVNEFRQRRPDATLETQASHGGLRANFQAEGAAHAVWFLPRPHSEAIYRIRYVEYFDGDALDQTLAGLGRAFGHPATANCYRGSLISRNEDCRLRFITGEGIEIDAVAQRPARDTRPATLTVTITDTMTEARLRAFERAANAT